MADEWYQAQIGPLPAGIWLLAGVAGIGLAFYANKHLGSGAAAETAPPTSTDATVPGVQGSGPGGVGLGGVVALPGGIVPADQQQYANPPAASTVILTNDDWLRQVEVPLVAKGYSSTVVDLSLRKYLEGDPLTAQENAIIELALQMFGPPPNPVPVAAPALPPEGNPVSTPSVSPVFYPNKAPLSTLPPGVNPCPPGYILETGDTGWLCATLAEHQALVAFLGATHA